MSSPRAVLGVASLGAALAFIDVTIVNVAFPDMRESFPDSSLSELSWVLNAYNIVFAAFIVAAGRIADLLGRKRLFEQGVILFTVTSVLCAVAPSVELLVAFRVLQAIGAAILVPASLALVLQAFPGSERSHGVALWTAVAALAAGVGPSLGGVLVELEGWRLAFLVNLPVGVLALSLSKRTLVESRAPGRRTLPDLPGALVLAAAVSALTLGIVKGQDWGWTSPAVLVSFAAALALGAVFVERCTWHTSPMLDLGLLRIRSIAVANAVTIVAAAGFYAYVLCNILFLTSVWDYTVLEAGLAITPGPFVAAAVARPASRLAQAVGERWTIALGAAVWGLGVAYLATQVGTTPAFVSEWLPAMAILGVGAGITFPVTGAAAVEAVPGGRFATATGLNSIARQLGAVLGVALLVAIVGTPSPAEVADAFDRGWVFAAVCFGVVAVVAPLLGRIEPAVDEEALSEAPASRMLRRETVDPDPAAARPVEPPAPPPRRTPAEFLRSVEMFAGLSESTLADMAGRASSVRVRAGDWLFREGDEADGVYVVVSGRVEVVVEGDEQQVLRTLGPAAVVGELALLARSTRSASIRARRDSELLKLTRDAFEAMLEGDPAFTTELVRLLGVQLQRSRSRDEQVDAPASVIALVPGHAGLPMAAIADCLVTEIARHAPVVRLDRFSQGDPAAEAGLLERYEQDYDHVLLVASEDEGEWRDFCIRHADRIAVVAGDHPVPPEAARRRALHGCELLFHAGAGTAERLGDWLDALAPRARHRLPDLDESVRVAGRRLAGRSVGLVLSGGGARALAHIGVLDELLAAGIRVDRLAGCSMGAFIGALTALGMDPDEIDAVCYEEWVRRYPLNDYRLPRVSLIRGERVTAMLQRNLPGSIEELERDYFCVTGDLVTAELVVHRRGTLWAAVGASMSLPGLVAPRVHGERLLVDGGVLNNLPVDVMAATGEGPVIAVDVTQQFERPAQAVAETNGGRRRRRTRDDELGMPGFTEALTRALMLGSADTAEAARMYADLVITPAGDGVGMLEFHQLDRMRDAGRRAAIEALERAPASVLG
jgi:NTE family protein